MDYQFEGDAFTDEQKSRINAWVREKLTQTFAETDDTFLGRR